ncbi:hypothetical protein ABZ668_28060, partial [Streptomyces parvus]
MSRTQWWSLTALLAVVLGLLCGPTAFASAGPGTPAAPVARVVLASQLSPEQLATRARRLGVNLAQPHVVVV